MVRRLIFVLLLCATAGAQVRFHVVEKDAILQRLQSAPDKNEDREKALEKMFSEVGCTPSEQALKHSKTSNVICVLKGTTEEEIVVGAHLDHVSLGQGIVDDWSGAALLPTLFESLKHNRRKHTIVFVAFTAEEEGLLGSAEYVQQMSPEERARVKAMVNLECLGMAHMKVWMSHSDKPLLDILVKTANVMKLDVQGVNVERVGTADSESFAAAKIPRITLHTVTQDTLRLLHSPNDNMKAIRPDDYYDNYKLVAGYLAMVDATLEAGGSK